jgi:Ferritin-like domain
VCQRGPTAFRGQRGRDGRRDRSDPVARRAGAATEDELAYANFGASTEFLVKDFYSKALEANTLTRSGLAAAKRRQAAAARHTRALSDVLVDAGDVAPVEEDFEFTGPAATFRTAGATVTTGLAILRALEGVYQSAAATVTEPSYRLLYASLAASDGQQIGALQSVSGRCAEPFPAAMDLERASDALEAYLG